MGKTNFTDVVLETSIKSLSRSESQIIWHEGRLEGVRYWDAIRAYAEQQAASQREEIERLQAELRRDSVEPR
jgi:hypothetical protein